MIFRVGEMVRVRQGLMLDPFNITESMMELRGQHVMVDEITSIGSIFAGGWYWPSDALEKIEHRKIKISLERAISMYRQFDPEVQHFIKEPNREGSWPISEDDSDIIDSLRRAAEYIRLNPDNYPSDILSSIIVKTFHIEGL